MNTDRKEACCHYKCTLMCTHSADKNRTREFNMHTHNTTLDEQNLYFSIILCALLEADELTEEGIRKMNS